MSQTSVIFAGLLIGFVVYVTLKGELPAYAAILWGSAPTSAVPASAPLAGNVASTAGTSLLSSAIL